ncbi:MAG: cytochrome c biogenesis protein CcdA [Hyphomicrobiaceae bacterium]
MSELHIHLGVALAGLLSFLSPCVLPLVPAYIGFLGGTTLDMLSEEGEEARAVYRRVVVAALFFVLGFTTVFVALGAGASLIGQVLLAYKAELAFAAGAVIVLFGLHFLGLLPIGFLYRELRYHNAAKPASLLGAYVIGLAFAFGWTPCIGPILSAVLAAAASQDSLGRGVGLLLVYSLGLGIPFLMAAIAIRPFLGLFNIFKRHLGKVEKVMGAALVVTGLLFMTGSINTFGNWMLETFPVLADVETWLTPDSLQQDILKPATP